VPIITAYLFHAGDHENPAKLRENEGKSFQGSIVLGMGFTFDDADAEGVATPIAEMHRLIAQNPCNADRIFPYIGGEEVNDSPTHAHQRYVINFADWPLKRADVAKTWAGATKEERRLWRTQGIVPLDYPDSVAADWPDLLSIIEQKVRPERMRQNDRGGREKWWQFLRPRPELQAAICGKGRVLVCSRIGNAFAFTFLPSAVVMNEKIVIFPFETAGCFTVIQSRVHEAWARFFSSTLKDDLQYTPSDCFETYPFPDAFETNAAIEQAGWEYYEFRAALMVLNNEGLTKTYNRFHAPDDCSPHIIRLRELHDAMDRAILDAYGWTDLMPFCKFLLDYEEDDDDEQNATGPSRRARRKPWRYRWPDDFRDEVLARLLELNKQRAEQEHLAGLSAEATSTNSRKQARPGTKSGRAKKRQSNQTTESAHSNLPGITT
jgi:hypothetical protein